jgi:response regulator RpfG family c-di-GMP phosphodiesterase
MERELFRGSKCIGRVIEMSEERSNGQPLILCVDDDELVLEGLRDTLRRAFEVRTAIGATEALAMLRKEPEAYAVVLSDMRMPGMFGSELLREARTVAPDCVRMLLTGYADIDSAIRAVNDAQLFRFLTKPCQPEQLVRACIAALAQHRLLTAERVLLEQTLRGCVNALVEVLALANPTAFGRAGRVRALVGKIAAAAELENRWEVEVAAMLAHIGAVTLPPETAEKLYAGATLSPEEKAMVERMPQSAHHLLANIPRLDGVLAILAYCHEPAGATNGTPPPAGGDVLRIAVDYEELESSGLTDSVALGALRGRGTYDPVLLDTLGQVVGVGRAAPVVRELAVGELRTGMTLADDVRTLAGGLLVARGYTVTEQLLERLANLRSSQVREPLRVID